MLRSHALFCAPSPECVRLEIALILSPALITQAAVSESVGTATFYSNADDAKTQLGGLGNFRGGHQVRPVCLCML